MTGTPKREPAGAVEAGQGGASARAGDQAGRQRLVGLDGIRGFAALFVVLHHCYLVSFPGFPTNNGPWWTGWLLYGHLAVAVFIVLSGFSLAVAPARAGWRLGSPSRFAHRRAWRILPPYWAALAFSLVMAWTVTPQPGVGAPTARSVAVFGLLAQDVVGAPTPNGAFWSIAVEAQLYVAFPLLLVVLARWGGTVMVGAVTTLVIAIGVLAPSVGTIGWLMRFTPQFAVLFALGVAAAGILRASERVRRLPWHWFAALAIVPVVVVLAIQGPVWWNAHQFWIDLAVGPSVALLLTAVTTLRPAPFVRLLDTAAVRRLGRFSYSLYLVHSPIVVAIGVKLVAPHTTQGLGRFGLTLAIGAPVAVAFAWLFSSVFELPFQRHRSWAALREAIGRSRVWRARTASAPAGVAEGVASESVSGPV